LDEEASLWLLFPAAVALLTLLIGRPNTSVIGATGLTLDIVGVGLLAEGLLLHDDDAAYLSSWGGIGLRHLLAQRDRYQAIFALVIAWCGFAGQVAPLIFG
jgi:hypothetical protein